MNTTTNSNIVAINDMAEEHYNKQTEGYGKQLNRQAKAQLEAWKGEKRSPKKQAALEAFLAMPEDVDCEGFASSDANGIDDMLASVFDAIPLDENGEQVSGYDSLSDWEQHGIVNIPTGTYYASEIVTAEELDNGDGTYSYAGDHAAADRKCITRRPISTASKVAAKMTEKPMTAADMVREARKLDVHINNNQLRRFQRAFKGQERNLNNLLAYVSK